MWRLPFSTGIAWSKVSSVRGNLLSRRRRPIKYWRAASMHAAWLRARASFADWPLLMVASRKVATVTRASTPMMIRAASSALPRWGRIIRARLRAREGCESVRCMSPPGHATHRRASRHEQATRHAQRLEFQPLGPAIEPCRVTKKVQCRYIFPRRRCAPVRWSRTSGSAGEGLVQEIAGEVAVVGERTAPGEPGVQLVEVTDALLAVLPAQVHGAAVQLAAEVDQPVGGLHLYAQLRHLVQDVAELPDQADRPRLQPLHRRRSIQLHDHVGPLDSPPGLLQLLLQAHQLVAQLPRPGEFLVQGGEERVRFAQRKQPGRQGDVHGRTLQNEHPNGKRITCYGLGDVARIDGRGACRLLPRDPAD